MIAILDYGAGNVRSVRNALERLGQAATITADPVALRAAERVIFPGVGEAASAMKVLRQRGLDGLIPQLSQPVLGICLGLQLLCRHSAEGDTAGLGVFDLAVHAFPATGRVPHMGWNDLRSTEGPLFQGIPAGTDFYFVHSYYAETGRRSTAHCNYLVSFSAALNRRNFHAVQFHPEKSGEAGERLLKNFLAL